MITKMNHVSVFVLDQDSAYEFYVNKLGFNVHTDAPMGPGMRWLTVCKGTFGFGVFECDNLPLTYEELKARGVVFTKAPTREFYGFEALFKDDSGNWFSLGEKSA